MITEDYVSFEVAKLLKEKGFYQDYYSYPVYWMNGNNPTLSFEGDDDFPYSQNECVAPSLAIAMKWLREVHKVHINISPYTDEKGNNWSFIFDKYIYGCWQELGIYITDSWNSYEEACEAAIKYCLINLI